MKEKMNQFYLRFGSKIAALALVLVAFNVNTCCALYAYQPEIPEKANRMKKFN